MTVFRWAAWVVGVVLAFELAGIALVGLWRLATRLADWTLCRNDMAGFDAEVSALFDSPPEVG